jgi:hypothetical protein
MSLSRSAAPDLAITPRRPRPLVGFGASILVLGIVAVLVIGPLITQLRALADRF